ncbi:MAG: phosphoribosylanthranilate isomerase [Actinomycetota bacterium]|nr:phosphoribosylanthranilate isomerase [Actinomycetota bacterium]
MVWVKICGITNFEDAGMVCRLGADAMGFILSTDSPRRVGLDKAKAIVDEVSKEKIKILKAGVFVNEEIKDILDFSGKLGLDYVQLSGDEDSNFLKKLKDESDGFKIIKALRIKSEEKIVSGSRAHLDKINQIIREAGRFADFILLDSYKKDVYGGTGETFNWRIAGDCSGRIPVILSGGLESGNVREAIDFVKPFGVDASSRLELYPGKKDPAKLKEFISAVRDSE